MNAPLRRGVCPGLSAPMQTGDGLLVRLLPTGTIPLPAFAGLCAAARTHGNGIIEVTARGSIQVRGLSAPSAPRFATTVGALGIMAEEGIPIHTGPLSELGAEEICDATALAAAVRRTLGRNDLAARLSPKVSVAIDGGGTLGLDTLPADVRLAAELINDCAVLRLGVGGDGAGAAELGVVAPQNAAEAVIRLFEVLAQRGRGARARDVLAAEGAEPFGAAAAHLLIGGVPHERARKMGEAIGTHSLRDGSFACGLGLAFGHADAQSLESLATTAAAAGASGVRTAPGRTLIIIGLGQHKVSTFAGGAERLGFIVRADDPRRRVIACAGAPICASAHIVGRAMAPAIAETAAQLGRAITIHLSGCAKGCAYPAAAALTVVGTPDGGALVANGTARDAPFAIVPLDQLPAAIAAAMREADHV